jgi:SAM-dependent methyltransferase
MAKVAATRASMICRGDAHHLPFRADSFGGTRADRVFQHLADPAGALDEMIRVTAPGGRVVIVDPDQASLALEVGGVRRSVLDRLQVLRRDLGYRNGTLIADMADLMGRRWLVQVSAERFPLVLTDTDDAFGIAGWPLIWRREGAFTDEELTEWDSAIRVRPVARFSYAVDFVVVAGTKP